MEYLGYLASIIIELSLGLIGGGGSILTIPILVYLFKIEPELATSYSLFIVGITSLFGCISHYKIGNLKIKSALYFAIPSVFSILIIREVIFPKIAATLFSIASYQVSKSFLIMIVFSVLMIAAAIAIIRKTKIVTNTPKTNYIQLGIIGFIVGIVTGFLGAGGGFLIIPALLFFANLPMKQAVGTSLLIIFINSTVGFGGDLYIGTPIDYTFLLVISSSAFLGMIIGTKLSKIIDGAKLKPIFGWFLLIMGIYIITKEIFFH
ncbi:sulfite exporter TauE/SafE family protein [Flavobacterium gawalongense]|uniref:Probable membrane transporter protein n=1 Tax=Flavobacterium gawalongense TaxID=2594432 RepID=A0A553BCS1_9FLAO|nr:sulfite exporter TauE/SafE family protein [Flavobacterium gawalongense]TRX06037.1 sulfite exporter TauE/SafE family protein [Flavobacterium gawalongense]TRX10965.1 sulfite exporter TauE/SafE family protein [Flavobacterium gawalongense]TRX22615.1 sulfite exporter TauE/SafE family protein [Flavobacterium gawalongense]